MEDYLNLQEELKQVKLNHEEKFDGKGLDAVWVGVFLNGSDWRIAKKLGLDKDYYYGYKLFSTSTNSVGYELYEAIKRVVGKHQLDVQVFAKDL